MVAGSVVRLFQSRHTSISSEDQSLNRSSFSAQPSVTSPIRFMFIFLSQTLRADAGVDAGLKLFATTTVTVANEHPDPDDDQLNGLNPFHNEVAFLMELVKRLSWIQFGV